jgi:hypothetical protein
MYCMQHLVAVLLCILHRVFTGDSHLVHRGLCLDVALRCDVGVVLDMGAVGAAIVTVL